MTLTELWEIVTNVLEIAVKKTTTPLTTILRRDPLAFGSNGPHETTSKYDKWQSARTGHDRSLQDINKIRTVF